MRVSSSLIVATWSGALASHSAGDLPVPLNFTNETASRIVQTVPENTGNNVKDVTFADFDNDGDFDVAIAVAGGISTDRQNKLYVNDGGVFTEVSGPPVISGFTSFDLTRHAFFRDYDGDGWLDLMMVNDKLFNGGHVKLYMNQHPGGVFSHFVEEGIARGLGEEASCGAVSEDFDQDGDVDLYSGNYPNPGQDTLFLNDGAGFFTIVTGTHLPTDDDYTIDVATSDMNGDGKLDLLVSNFSPDWIYYNDLEGAGDDGVGDFRYGASGNDAKQDLGASADDGAMEAGDFNGDGLTDFYRTNRDAPFVDRIQVNLGNDKSGMATFGVVAVPPYPASNEGNKVTVGDLNADGRDDILVGMLNGRPAVLRNTSVNGEVSFVDWTPAPAFPTGSVHRGHHGAIFDTNGDGDVDIFFGGRNDDHLFEQTDSVTYDEADLGDGGGPIDGVFNGDAVAVYGDSALLEADTYNVTGIGAGGFLSVVLNGSGDYLLEILDPGGAVVASSNRGGLGVEEALQHAVASAGTYDVRVTIIGCAAAGDTNGDCAVDVDDLIAVLNDWGQPGSGTDVNQDGVVNVDDLVIVLSGWGGGESDYLLEIVSRDG